MLTLLAAGGVVDSQRDSGATPLFSAVQQNASPALVQLLIDAGADIETETNVRLVQLASF